MKTARYDETHSPGARHATAWLDDPEVPLTGSELMTLAVVGCAADSDYASATDPEKDVGYVGISAERVAWMTHLNPAQAKRRLERLVEVGALERRTWLGDHRYWIPETVRLP